MDRRELPDLFTVVSIAIIVGAICDVLHEGLGHGGACLLVGATPKVISTVHFDCSIDSRFLSAGGTIANLVAGALSLIFFRFARSPRFRYFFWLLVVFNFLSAGGYWLYSGFANIGDWAYVIHDLRPRWAWRVGLTVFGIITYYLFVLLSARLLRTLLSPDPEISRRRARRLTFPAYFAHGGLLTVAGLFNPVGMFLVAISAMAASFGGTSGLLWMGMVAMGGPLSREEAPVVTRSYTWIVIAAITASLFIFVFGRGVRLS